ncbi:MAG: tellurite resistance TerB family protein [Tabrizicola sp.]|jgi:hypothetical protein|nr:tellurite resistance TerB family protein [Tabrizicola sp.]
MGIGKTLLKVAIGVLVAKGVSTFTRGASGSTTAGRGTRVDTRSKGGLEDIMGDVLGSGRSSGRTTKTSGGGLGDLLEQMSGQKRSQPRASAPKGGVDDLLGQLGGRSSGGGLGRRSKGGGDLLDQVLADKPGGKGSLRTGPVSLPEPEAEDELSAALILRAVIQAVKCDGELDDAERERLMQAMGEAGEEDVHRVQAELSRPVDVAGLARLVPAGLEPQVYMASLMAIDLDSRAEADYLHELAGALDLGPDQVNAIHDRAGVQRLYR